MSATQILVVEDERLVATALQNELEHFGYQVSGIASSAKEAVEKAKQNKPDLVLMDIHLKGDIDGIEAARTIHARWGTPVVYLSAFSDPPTVARASETEAFGYLLKPYEERELQTTIEMAIAKHRAEQRLEESERWLAAIHNSIGDAVIGADRNQQIRFMNPAAEAMTGWRRAHAIGIPITAVCHLVANHDRAVLDDLAGSVIRDRYAVELPANTRLISIDGRETPIEGTLSAIHDPQGELLGTVLSLRDISGRLTIEQLQRQSEAAARRTQKIEAMSRLAGGLGEPLNNLLTVILSNTSLVLTGAVRDADREELLHKTEMAAQRAARLVHRLHIFSTVVGRPTSEFEQVDLRPLVEACLKGITPLLDPNIKVQFNPHSDPWPVAADELLLGQALLELAHNAQEAMELPGRINFEIENVTLTAADMANHPDGQPGEFVRLRVSDSGEGMTPEIRARILEPGFTSKVRGQSGGLGLALVASVMAHHHGWIECSSQAPHGTCFDLYFPRYGVEGGAEGGAKGRLKPHGETPTILLVDADPLVRESGREILAAEGYRVLTAEDGVQAIAIYRKEPSRIDLAILDLNMPRLTAYAVMERMLEIDPHAKALFSGGYFSEDLTASAGHTVGVIAKPYRHDELVDMVRRALATAQPFSP